MANRNHRLKRAYGMETYGFADLPVKVSNVKVARIKHTEDRGGCSCCFPHGPETTNAACKNKRRNWKNHRAVQWEMP